MTQEQKDLLLKDLCARLPYGVRFSMKVWDDKEGKIVEKIAELEIYNKYGYAVGNIINGPRKEYVGEIIKPYLFPLSSMTEEQKEEWKSLLIREAFSTSDNVLTPQDFYCKYHLDYRGLIPMGLAIDATGLNIY